MGDAFDIFNYDNSLTWISVTPSYHDEQGIFSPEVKVPTTINGHIKSITESELQFLQKGVSNTGVVVLYTGNGSIKKGDKIKVTNDDDTITTWYVLKIPDRYNVLKKITGISRYKYYLTTQK